MSRQKGSHNNQNKRKQTRGDSMANRRRQQTKDYYEQKEAEHRILDTGSDVKIRGFQEPHAHERQIGRII